MELFRILRRKFLSAQVSGRPHTTDVMAETRKPEKDPSFHHVPPQNLEAEESILSAILINNNALLDVIACFGTKIFTNPGTGRYSPAIYELFNRNDPVDLITLANILKQRGELEETLECAAHLASLWIRFLWRSTAGIMPRSPMKKPACVS